MREKALRYAKEILIFLTLMILLSNIISFYKSSDLNKEKLLISNVTLIDGSAFQVKHNKPILVHIWATWCPTCKIEASNIQTLSEHFEVLTIAVKSGSDEEVNAWIQEKGYTFKVLNDSSGYFSSQFNISAFPTTFIYNKEKELIFSEVGYTSTLGLLLRMWWSDL